MLRLCCVVMRVRWSLFGVHCPRRIARVDGFVSGRGARRGLAPPQRCGTLARPVGGELTLAVRSARTPTIWVDEIVHMRRGDQQYLRRRDISRGRTASRTTASTGHVRARRRSSTLTLHSQTIRIAQRTARRPSSCETVSKPQAPGATTCRAPTRAQS